MRDELFRFLAQPQKPDLERSRCGCRALGAMVCGQSSQSAGRQTDRGVGCVLLCCEHLPTGDGERGDGWGGP
jgi:hypothetical protein